MVGTSIWTRPITRWVCRKKTEGLSSEHICKLFKEENPKWLVKEMSVGSVKYILGGVHDGYFGKRSEGCKCSENDDSDREELAAPESANSNHAIDPLLRLSVENHGAYSSPYQNKSSQNNLYQNNPYQNNQINNQLSGNVSHHGSGSRASSRAIPEARMVSDNSQNLQSNFGALDDEFGSGIGLLQQSNLNTPWPEGADPAVVNFHSQASATAAQHEVSHMGAAYPPNSWGNNFTGGGAFDFQQPFGQNNHGNQFAGESPYGFGMLEEQEPLTPRFEYPPPPDAVTPPDEVMGQHNRRQKAAEQSETLKKLAEKQERARMMTSMGRQIPNNNTPVYMGTSPNQMPLMGGVSYQMTDAGNGFQQGLGSIGPPISYPQQFATTANSVEAQHMQGPQTGNSLQQQQMPDQGHGVPLGSSQKEYLARVVNQAKLSKQGGPALNPFSPPAVVPSSQAQQLLSMGSQQNIQTGNATLTASQRRTLAQNRKQLHSKGSNGGSQIATGTLSGSTTANPPAKATRRAPAKPINNSNLAAPPTTNASSATARRSSSARNAAFLRAESGENALNNERPVEIQSPFVVGKISLPENPQDEIYVEPVCATPIQDNHLIVLRNPAKPQQKLVDWLKTVGGHGYVMLPRQKLPGFQALQATRAEQSNYAIMQGQQNIHFAFQQAHRQILGSSQPDLQQTQNASQSLASIVSQESALGFVSHNTPLMPSPAFTPQEASSPQQQTSMNQQEPSSLPSPQVQHSTPGSKRPREDYSDDVQHPGKRLKALVLSVVSAAEPVEEDLGEGNWLDDDEWLV
ncbi:hypothetical protein HYALB_00005357 [Hymenoscyphus albidus]|uniref:Uncharacterized protein n=1 Tax=Hymenoscyphus albidus TaxID=595503 RepID=A0A9N9LW79_9HELO|nr:hypothetical protein HYALB_00005357 [Hymenoscyphus albidus]